MIGQRNLQSRIERLIEDGTFPRFSIFVGPKGSGRKTFVHKVIIKDLTEGLYEESGIKVDDVRNLITDAYKIHSIAVYFIPDADNMSNAAKNALLKVTEEPPNSAYFIMTLEDETNTLETIRSRGTVFHMDRYTPDEIEEYYWTVGQMPNDAEIVKAICDTPGEVNLIKDCARDLYDYVNLVVDNIAEVSLANAFKIPSKVALKDDAEGYDLRLFWKAFCNIVMETAKDIYFGTQYREVSGKYLDAYNVTNKYLQKLRVKGINRQMLIDNWVMEIRELWQN